MVWSWSVCVIGESLRTEAELARFNFLADANAAPEKLLPLFNLETSPLRLQLRNTT